MTTRQNICETCTSNRCKIFSKLLFSNLESPKKLVRPVTYKKRAIVFTENNPMAHVFVVKRGIIKIYKSLDDGRQQTLRLCDSGDILGLDKLFKTRYAYTAKTVTESELCKINKASFLILLVHNPSLAVKLLQATSQELALSRNQVFNLGVRTAKERVASFLLYVYNSQCNCRLCLSCSATRRLQSGCDIKTSKTINLFFTRQEISELLGIKQETVVRTLHQMSNDNLIRVEGNKIALLDIEQLFYLSGSSEDHVDI